MNDQGRRSPIWFPFAVILSVLAIAGAAGQLEAHGWAFVGWEALLVASAVLMWVIWWKDVR